MRFFLALFLLHCSISPQERNFLLREPIVQNSDAFSMIGDSRTQYVFKINQTVDWDDWDFLGQFKTDCSLGKLGIQNAGVAGSTTEHWLEFFKSEFYRPEDFHENIVLMIGGNDIQRNAYKWRGFTINKQDKLETAIEEIHQRVVEIVDILKYSNKKIIIQTHFKVNPTKSDAHNKALNEGLEALNRKLIKTYGDSRLTNGKNLVKDVSLAFIEPKFPAEFFVDLVHLNPLGYQMHASYLSKELNKRCWW